MSDTDINVTVSEDEDILAAVDDETIAVTTEQRFSGSYDDLTDVLHAVQHEAGGTDEISLGGMEVPADEKLFFDEGGISAEYDGGSSELRFVDESRDVTMLAVPQDGPVRINDRTNGLKVQRSLEIADGGGAGGVTMHEISDNFFNLRGDGGVRIATEGSGDPVVIRDGVNDKDLAVFNQGGPVEIVPKRLNVGDSGTSDYLQITAENQGTIAFGDGGIAGQTRFTRNAGDVYLVNEDGGSVVLRHGNGNDLLWRSDDILSVPGPTTIKYDADAGSQYFADIPVTSSPTAGTEQSLALSIDGSKIVKAYAEADGSGGIQNQRLVLGSADLDVLSGNLRMEQNAVRWKDADGNYDIAIAANDGALDFFASDGTGSGSGAGDFVFHTRRDFVVKNNAGPRHEAMLEASHGARAVIVSGGDPGTYDLDVDAHARMRTQTGTNRRIPT